MLFRDHDLFIFDWDGTLCTSTSIVKATRVFKMRYNIHYIENHREEFRVESIEKLNKEEEVSRIYSVLDSIYSLFAKTRLKEGSIELLKKLKIKGKKIAVFSDANRYRLFLELKRLGVLDYIDFALSADSIKRFKPNPTGLSIILAHFRKGKKSCVYIGDMAADIYTARFAGIDSASVCDGVDPKRLLVAVGPKYLFRDIKQLIDAV